MQVNIFVSEADQTGAPTTMLVLPYGPEATIPKHLQGIEWRYLATAEADDRLIGLSRPAVEASLHCDGFVLVAPIRSEAASELGSVDKRDSQIAA